MIESRVYREVIILMICALKLYGNKCIVAVLVLIGGCMITDSVNASCDTSEMLQALRNYKEAEASDQDKDDEQLIAEIWSIGAMLYKNMIDMSALYFSGILIDSNQLYDRMMFDVGKNLFQVVKLLAWYGPKMLQNPNISWKIKAKKTGYMVSFIVLFWLWSQEVSKQKKRNKGYRSDSYDMGQYRSMPTGYGSEETLNYRPRPSMWS